jgi:hypothetical protein
MLWKRDKLFFYPYFKIEKFFFSENLQGKDSRRERNAAEE